MRPPENLKIGRVLIAPAELPPTPMWAVFLALDRGGIAHVQYVGLLVETEGETTEELFARAEAKVRAVNMET